MKTTIVCAALLFLIACNDERVPDRHQYIVERVKDINGNDCFLRIDVEAGEECVIGHGWVVNRLMSGAPPEMGYIVPFCGNQQGHQSKKP